MGLTVAEIKRRLQEADEREFAVLERSLVADARKGVRDAVEVARRRIEAERAERERLAALYAYERELAQGRGVEGARLHPADAHGGQAVAHLPCGTRGKCHR